MEGNLHGAKLVPYIIDNNEAQKITEMLKKPENYKMSVEKALSMIIEGNLTTHSYNLIRQLAIEHGHDLYLSYQEVI